MFDEQVSTATTATGTLAVVLAPGYATSIALLGLVGSTLEIVVRDGAGGPVVYETTTSLDGSFVYDWYMYFYEPLRQISEFVVTDIPPYVGARVSLTLTGGSAIAIGHCSVGNAYDLGPVEIGAQLSLVDYSKKETDEFGTTTFVRRANAKTMSVSIIIDKGAIVSIWRLVAELTAMPVVWIGGDGDADYAMLTFLGFLKDFRQTIAYPTKSLCTFEVEGLT